MRLHDRPLGFCAVCLVKGLWEPAVAIYQGTGYCRGCLQDRPTRDIRVKLAEEASRE
jgi:hypothetical protein